MSCKRTLSASMKLIYGGNDSIASFAGSVVFYALSQGSAAPRQGLYSGACQRRLVRSNTIDPIVAEERFKAGNRIPSGRQATRPC